MDLSYTDEQELLRAMTRRSLEDHCGVPRVLELREGDEHDPALWRVAAALGWPACLLPQPHGPGFSTEDATIVFEETGRVLAPIPLGPAALAAWLVDQLAGRATRGELLPQLASGRSIAAVVAGASRLDDDGAEVVAADRDGDGVVLTGGQRAVRAARVADHFVVPVRLDGVHRVAVVPRDAAGTTVRPQVTAGRLCEASVAFDRTPASLLATPLERAQRARFQALAIVLEAAVMAGACERVLEMTVEHVTEREQFDRPLAGFQVVQHRVADMLVDLDGIRWHLRRTAAAFDRTARSPTALLDNTGLDAAAPGGDEQPEVGYLADTLAVWTARAAERVVASAHQLHGGVGFIREHPLHAYTGRQISAALTWGLVPDHEERVAQRLLDA